MGAGIGGLVAAKLLYKQHHEVFDPAEIDKWAEKINKYLQRGNNGKNNRDIPS